MELSLTEREIAIWEYLKGVNYFGFETVNTEYNLMVRIGEYFFGGRLDALVKKDEKFYILDYKTGTAPKNAKYDYQTMIYLLAVRGFYHTDQISFVFLDLKNKTEVIIDLTAELVQEYETKLLEVAKKIETAEFFPKQKECKCEYNLICF